MMLVWLDDEIQDELQINTSVLCELSDIMNQFSLS
jgi:hypothetical protein